MSLSIDSMTRYSCCKSWQRYACQSALYSQSSFRIIPVYIFRACLHQASASMQSQCCYDACDIALIEKNRVAQKGLCSDSMFPLISMRAMSQASWQWCAGAWCKREFIDTADKQYTMFTTKLLNILFFILENDSILSILIWTGQFAQPYTYLT